MDLVDEKMRETVESYANDYREMGYDVLFTSINTSESIDILKPFLEGCVSVVAGQSGVGKSSMLNVLRPDLALKTDDISSHLGRGKHTTRHVELIAVGSGLVADTPGFSSLDFIDIEVEDLTYCFPELKEESQYCKFRGCTHLSEPKCAVKAAVEEGKLHNIVMNITNNL